MKIEASAAAAGQAASRVLPLGQHPLGKAFRPLVSQPSSLHLTADGQSRPASGDGAASGNILASGDVTAGRNGTAGRGEAADEEGAVQSGRRIPSAPQRIDHVYYHVSRQLKRHLRQSRKPPVVVVADSPQSEVLHQAISAFGGSPSLRQVANLVVAFPRAEPSEVDELADGCPKQLLLAIDRYDLYGHIAILRPRNPREEMTELLRIARDRRGVLLADGSDVTRGCGGVKPSLLRLSSALRVPVISADGGAPLDGRGRPERQGASDARDDSTHNRRLGPVARIHALLA